jgi:hypothetical protein
MYLRPPTRVATKTIQQNRPPKMPHMSRPSLEVADIFHGPARRRANARHACLGQLKVMSAIESCRARWPCRAARSASIPRSLTTLAATGSARRARPGAKDWLAARKADPLRYHSIMWVHDACENKAVYDLLLEASAETLTTIIADPRHLGARVGSPRSSMPGARP